MASDLAQVAHMRLKNMTTRCKHVFFCGNYVNHPLMRQLITQEWVQHHLTAKIFAGIKVCNTSNAR